MNIPVHHRIKMLIEETNDAFSTSDGCMNADYAEFATLALSEFKHILRNPQLTRSELTTMLRSGMVKHRHVDPESNWASFMAHYIARTSNKDVTGFRSMRKAREKQEEVQVSS